MRYVMSAGQTVSEAGEIPAQLFSAVLEYQTLQSA